MIYLTIGLILIFSIVFFENKKNTNLPYWSLCLILVLLAALRYSVGGDTQGYMDMWEYLPTLTELRSFDFFGLNMYQPFWYVINAIAKYIYDDFVSIQIILAIIVNFSIFSLFNKYSSYRFTCILVYYLMSYPYFNFEILRESLSICVFLFSISFLINKKWIKYFLLITIAFLFHTSAIILFFLPLFLPLLEKKINFQSVMYLTGISLLITSSYSIDFIISNLFPSLKTLVEIYLEWEWPLIGLIVNLIKCLLIYLLIMLRQKYNLHQPMIDIPLKIYMFFSIFTLIMPIGQRFQNYFIMFFIMGFVDLLCKFRGKEFIIKYTIVLFFTLVTLFYYLQDTTGLTGVESRFGELFYPYFSVFDEVNSQDLYIRKSIYYNISKYDY